MKYLNVMTSNGKVTTLLAAKVSAELHKEFIDKGYNPELSDSIPERSNYQPNDCCWYYTDHELMSYVENRSYERLHQIAEKFNDFLKSPDTDEDDFDQPTEEEEEELYREYLNDMDDPMDYPFDMPNE